MNGGYSLWYMVFGMYIVYTYNYLLPTVHSSIMASFA